MNGSESSCEDSNSLSYRGFALPAVRYEQHCTKAYQRATDSVDIVNHLCYIYSYSVITPAICFFLSIQNNFEN